MDEQQYQYAINRMIIGGLIGFIFIPVFIFAYLFGIDFFKNNCCPDDFDFISNEMVVFLILLFGGGSGANATLLVRDENGTYCFSDEIDYHTGECNRWGEYGLHPEPEKEKNGNKSREPRNEMLTI